MLGISKLVAYQGGLSFQSPPTYVSSKVLLHKQQLVLLYSWKRAPAPPPRMGLWQQLLHWKARRQTALPETVRKVDLHDLNLNTDTSPVQCNTAS